MIKMSQLETQVTPPPITGNGNHQPRPLKRVNPLVRDLGLTSATQIASFLAAIIVTSLFGRLIGALALSEYLLLRRVWAWMIAGTQLGMPVALPRYIAHSMGKGKLQ